MQEQVQQEREVVMQSLHVPEPQSEEIQISVVLNSPNREQSMKNVLVGLKEFILDKDDYLENWFSCEEDFE